MYYCLPLGIFFVSSRFYPHSNPLNWKVKLEQEPECFSQFGDEKRSIAEIAYTYLEVALAMICHRNANEIFHRFGSSKLGYSLIKMSYILVFKNSSYDDFLFLYSFFLKYFQTKCEKSER